MSEDRIGNAWEFVQKWYTEREVHRAIGDNWRNKTNPIPRDIQSEEFSKWLTHQYRLAMMKGIDLARQETQSAIDEATAELSQERSDLAMLVRRLCHRCESPTLVRQAMDYLQRKGLQGSVLR